MVSWPDSWKPSTAVNSKVHRYGRPGREPRGPGVPDASSHVLGVGQPTLYLERLEQVCSPSLLIQMSILAEHREKSGLGLQNVAISSYRVSTLLAPPHPQGRGTKVTPLPGFRASQIGFQVCQENMQGLGLPTRTEQEDPAVWFGIFLETVGPSSTCKLGLRLPMKPALSMTQTPVLSLVGKQCIFRNH